jgi:hypothetical protein
VARIGAAAVFDRTLAVTLSAGLSDRSAALSMTAAATPTATSSPVVMPSSQLKGMEFLTRANLFKSADWAECHDLFM